MYADDIVVAGNDLEGREALRRCLIKDFMIKELDRLKYFLTIRSCPLKAWNLCITMKIHRGFVEGNRKNRV